MASFGLRSTTSLAKDGALVVGSMVVSTAISVIVSPVLAAVKAQVHALLTLLGLDISSGNGKFIFDFLSGGADRMVMSTFMSPFNLFTEGYRFASIGAMLFDGVSPPGSLWQYAVEQYTDGGVAAFCDTPSMIILNGLRYFPSQLLNFVLKDRIKKLFPKYNAKVDFWKFFASNMASGAFAGACSLSVLYPLDHVKTQILLARARRDAKGKLGALSALDEKLLNSSGAFEAIGHVHREQGALGMYSGFGVSVAGITAYRGPYFGMFDTLKAMNPWSRDKGFKGFASKFAIAQTTAILAGFCSFPFDVIRRGQQMAPKLSAREVASRVYEANGLAGFLTGFGLQTARTIAGAIWLVLKDVLAKKLFPKVKE